MNPAQVGSKLLSQLVLVSTYAKWLNPLRMVALALLFTAIIVALAVIIHTLRMQSQMLAVFREKASGG